MPVKVIASCLSPNCSISWRELLLFYLLTCVVALAIGLFFTLQGLWLVLPFSGLEMLALGIGLYFTSRKVYRREVITLDRSARESKKVCSGRSVSGNSRRPGCASSTTVRMVLRARRKLAIGMSGESVEVGSFLANWEKDALAFQLKDCIIRV